jgi:hypothetical protein
MEAQHGNLQRLLNRKFGASQWQESSPAITRRYSIRPAPPARAGLVKPLFLHRPERFNDLHDILVEQIYRDLPALREVCLAVFAGVKSLFVRRGVYLYRDKLDPDLPNRPYLEPYDPQEVGSPTLAQRQKETSSHGSQAKTVE